MRKRYSAKFKTKVAVEAIKNEKTITSLATEFDVNREMIQKWKKTALDGIPMIFSDNKVTGVKSSEKTIDELYRQIGQLKVENDWLKKKL